MNDLGGAAEKDMADTEWVHVPLMRRWPQRARSQSQGLLSLTQTIYCSISTNPIRQSKFRSPAAIPIQSLLVISLIAVKMVRLCSLNCLRTANDTPFLVIFRGYTIGFSPHSISVKPGHLLTWKHSFVDRILTHALPSVFSSCFFTSQCPWRRFRRQRQPTVVTYPPWRSSNCH